MNLAMMIAAVWGLGTVCIILKHVKDYYRFRRLLDFLPKTQDKRINACFSSLNLRGRISEAKIIVHSLVESPAVVGLLHPVILLPDICFKDDELLGILIHETTHYKYCHSIIKCLTEVVRACFWWNPVFKELSLEIAHALELQSDKAVCRKINKEQQKQYLIGIAKVAEQISHKSSVTIYSCSLIEDKNGEKLKMRFQMILGDFYQAGNKRSFLILPVIAATFLLSYSIVFQPYSLPGPEDIGPTEPVNSECYLVEMEYGYDLYDSSHHFIAQISYIDDSLKDLKIYQKIEDIPGY